MLRTQTRAPVPGAALARLLARMKGLDATPSTRSPADRLGDWLEWQRAVVLSRALDDEPPDDGAEADAEGNGPTADAGAAIEAGDALAIECRHARVTLHDAIVDEARDWTLPLRPRAGEDGTSAAAGAAAVQRHCQGLQRDMQSASGRLRGELREHLALRGEGPARLANVDAVMEGLLAPREHALLAPTVAVLVARFEWFHAQHAENGAAPAAGRGDWRARFRSEARQVLLAELDLRFQPIEALLAALHSPPPDA